MQLSIIIVNYNVKHFLEQCLYSVQAAISQLQAEVFVVDNNSTDGSMDSLQPHFSWVKWIVNTNNPGFGAANNQALAQATGEYILFLNPDTLLPEDCLEKSLAFIKAHPQAGALGIKMLDGSGQYLPESKRGFPAPLTSLFKLSGLAASFPTSQLFARYYLGHLPNNENNVVDVLAGAFMLVRNAALQQTGGFDEQFFMYGEDIDLSYRIQKAGWQNWYFADSSIIHFKGESTKKGSLNYVRMFYQAMSVFVKKHYSGGSAIFYRWFIEAAIWGKAGVAAIVSGGKNIRQQLLKKSLDVIQKKDSDERIFVIGSRKAFSDVLNLLQAAGVQNNKVSRIAPDEDLDNSIGRLQELNQLLATTKVSAIIFCVDDKLSMKNIIQQMQQSLPVNYAFHYTNSNCIISSSSKDSTGQWLSV